MKGHEQGARTVRRIVEDCVRLGVQELTLFAFSMENWKRPPAEVRVLMVLLRRFLISERRTMHENGIRLRAIGRLEALPENVREELTRSIDETAQHSRMTVRVALNYGGRGEIVDAMRQMAERVQRGELAPEDIDEALVEQHLYDPSMTSPDLLIRTAGEYRLSNFLLWQLSYSEIHVTDRCWPEFTEEDLAAAMDAYRGRVRKFGGLEPVVRC